MNHRLKSLTFKVLDKMPRKWGDYIYHRLQDNVNPPNVAHSYEKSKESFNTIQKLLLETDFDLTGKTALEIGSGWMPIMPYLFLYKGKAADVISYDINEHYHPARIVELNDFFAENLQTPIQPGESIYPIPNKVQYHPYTDDIAKKLPPASVDVLFSRFVLEHVPPDDILAIHKQAKKYLKPGGRIVHLISPSDQRAYSDKRICLWDFLQYSPAEWDRIQTRFDYHNRLRMPQYLEIFKEAGWEVLINKKTNPRKGGHQLTKFRKLKIDRAFAQFDEMDLTAGNLRVVLAL